ncbi:hypothetical protein SUDANB130_05295 [Streptomyces sp. enrichment culture]
MPPPTRMRHRCRRAHWASAGVPSRCGGPAQPVVWVAGARAPVPMPWGRPWPSVRCCPAAAGPVSWSCGWPDRVVRYRSALGSPAALSAVLCDCERVRSAGRVGGRAACSGTDLPWVRLWPSVRCCATAAGPLGRSCGWPGRVLRYRSALGSPAALSAVLCDCGGSARPVVWAAGPRAPVPICPGFACGPQCGAVRPRRARSAGRAGGRAACSGSDQPPDRPQLPRQPGAAKLTAHRSGTRRPVRGALVVLPCEVGDAAGGWLPFQRGVSAVVIVGVQPLRERLAALGF